MIREVHSSIQQAMDYAGLLREAGLKRNKQEDFKWWDTKAVCVNLRRRESKEKTKKRHSNYIPPASFKEDFTKVVW